MLEHTKYRNSKMTHNHIKFSKVKKKKKKEEGKTFFLYMDL